MDYTGGEESKNMMRLGMWVTRKLEPWKSGEAGIGSASGVWDSDVTILRCWQGMQEVMSKVLQ